MPTFPDDINQQSGFTLVEVMCALVVLTIATLSLISMQIGAIQTNATAQRLTTGCTWAADRIERLINLDLNIPSQLQLLSDTNNNGVGGLDNTRAGNVVQADHVFTLNADGTDNVVQSGGAVPAVSNNYLIYWNVAANSPTPNTRTIRVITVWNDRGTEKTTVMNYVKSSL